MRSPWVSGRAGCSSRSSDSWRPGPPGLIQPDLTAGTITVVTAIWVLLAFFGLVQLLSAIRHSLG